MPSGERSVSEAPGNGNIMGKLIHTGTLAIVCVLRVVS